MLLQLHSSRTDSLIEFTPLLEQMVACVHQHWPNQPRVGLLLGSGLGELATLMECDACIDYSELPSFPRSTAAGHAGHLLCGRIGTVPIVALVGRSHLYEGYSADQLTLPIRLLHALGARELVLTNASGGLNPTFRRGDVMLIRDHLCLQFLHLAPAEGPINHSTCLSRTAYDQSLADLALGAALRHQIPLRQGVYVAVTGPNYETRAEYRMLRNLGGDAVGMSTAVEAVAAARLGMQTLGLSMIANVALPDCPQRVTHEEVLAAGGLAQPAMASIIRAVIQRLAG